MPPRLRDPLSKRLFHGYEAYVAARGRIARDRAGDGELPLPPPAMRVAVVGHADPEPFLEQGRRHNEIVREAVARAGGEVGAGTRILEWGCGCGRMTRWWADLPEAEIHGCDYNPKLVRWVDRHLPFVEGRTNDLRPPLPYPAAEFDVAYAISIFTHQTDELAQIWMAEIHRVLRPGGLFFFTTHGCAYRDRLSAHDAARFDAQESVVLFPGAEGSNLCASYHHPGWVREHLCRDFELIELRQAHELPAGDLDGLLQDRWLVRRQA
jgi:SAM-dependent methyltransferase